MNPPNTQTQENTQQMPPPVPTAAPGSAPSQSVSSPLASATHHEQPIMPPSSNMPPSGSEHQKKSVPFPFIIVLLIVSFIGGLLLAAWYFQNQFQKIATPETVTKTTPTIPIQTITIGTDATFQPMEYIDDQGTLIGYDIDLGYRIGTELGATVIYKNIPWQDLFTSLEQGDINMIISGVTITDERTQLYDFSDPYLNAGQVIITRRDTQGITSAATIKGKTIAVQEGTTGETEALQLTDESLVKTYPNYVEATKALVEGKVDAVLSDLPAAKGVITANPSLKIASDPLTNESYGIVFRKGDPTAKQVNEVLTALRVKGILTDLKQKWLD